MPPVLVRTLVVRVAAVSLVAVLLVLLGWKMVTAARGQNLGSAVTAGRSPAAPEFELPRLGGKGTLRLSSLRGKVVVVNFWASWCAPCKDEAPLLERAWRRWRARGVVILGVNAQDFTSDARAFVRRYGLTYPSVHDAAGETLERYGVTGFPETWFVNREGRLVAERVQGPLTAVQLERDIEVALE
jgi:cytochrome c biogenesis protein CcmG/thiol:disulfide interchange protein DsbE